MIKLKRAYDPATPDDGIRILVDRIWPRGVTKDAIAIQRWEKELAPSTELRKWYGHDLERWPAFRERYQQELRDPAKRPALDRLTEEARNGTVTLVFSARDAEHNQAVVLMEILTERGTEGSVRHEA